MKMVKGYITEVPMSGRTGTPPAQWWGWCKDWADESRKLGLTVRPARVLMPKGGAFCTNCQRVH